MTTQISGNEPQRLVVPAPDVKFTRIAEGVRHSLGGILTPVVAFGEMLSFDPVLDAQAKGDVAAINEASRRAELLMDRLLKAAGSERVESVKLTVIDIAEIIEEAWDSDIKTRIVITDQINGSYIPELADEEVTVDIQLLRGIIKELSSNSEKAHATEAIIYFGARSKKALLRVQDNGDGPQAETFDMLAEPYFTTWGVQSEGLGLAVVNGSIRSMGGQLALETTGDLQGFTAELSWPSEGIDAEEMLFNQLEAQIDDPTDELEKVLN